MNINYELTPAFDVYWRFAYERQRVFFNRLKGNPSPWTEDSIIQQYKFTNAYRASDRVSQYLIRNVIYSKDNFTPENIIFRIILFKLFNKIETWEFLQNNLREISLQTYNFENIDYLLRSRMINGQKIYSSAYIMPSGKREFGHEKKHQNHLMLLEYMMKTGISKKIARAKSLKELYKVFLDYPTMGPFLSFQMAIDVNYSELCDFSEMSFVVAGPGARSGIMKCINGVDAHDFDYIIKFAAYNQENEFLKRGLHFQTLFGRPLQLIDCQNLFCETDKYTRVALPEIDGFGGRKRIKQKYSDKGYPKIDFFYPPKWGLNEKIKEYV